MGERPAGILTATLDRELVDSFEYGTRAAAFEPVLAAVQQRLASAIGLQQVAAAARLMAEQELEYLVVVNLAVSQYPKGRSGVFAKNVLLGTGHERPVKFVTAEDKLLQVLQVTGVIVNAEGQVVRAGAEGILARDTPFIAQVVELEKMLDDEALAAALDGERREDLPGAPLSLEVAVDNLVGQLLRDPRRVLRPL